MAAIALFHSALGVNSAVYRIADDLRAANHDVRIMDVYEGATFDSYDAGRAERDRLGYAELMRRALAAASDVPDGMVVIGLSMGTALAAAPALARPATGAVLISGIPPLDEYPDAPDWPASTPVQLHRMADDPLFTDAQAQPALARLGLGGAQVDEYVYDGAGHLFMDPSRPQEFDGAATAQMVGRILDFLELHD